MNATIRPNPKAGVRVLLVGCGRIAGGFNEQSEEQTLTHVLAFRRAGAEIAACCDIDPEVARRFAARWHVRQHGADFQQLLDTARPDVVSVATPPDSQESILEMAVRCASVRALLLEKPLAADGAAADRSVSLLKRWGRPVVVNFFRAFDPCYRQITDEARSGRLGRLRHAVGRYYGSARINASHLVERVLDLTSGGVGRAIAITQETSDAPLFVLPFINGGEAVFLPSLGLDYAPFELDLLFERGRVRVVDAERRVERFEVTPDPDYPEYNTLAVGGAYPTPDIASFTRPFDTVIRAVREDAAPNYAGLERAAAVTHLLDQVLEQRVS